MDCNKDEALRAKQVAEKKMETNDFEGARKIALKAQNLFPEIENIKQMLSVCDVHCSAQKTLSGLEKDWYGILHVDRWADDSTVKKQYRRLALYLHPDKNQFPGAEAAFKVICEAYAVLSDPVKKSLYDTKLRGTVTVKSAPVRPAPHHSNKNSQGSMQFTPVFSSSASYHPVSQTNNTREGIFCTMCPFCSLKHQCCRKFLNTTLRCQKCFKNFLGYEIFSESACSVPKSCGTQVPVGQSAGFQEKGGPKCQFSTDDVQNMASPVNAPRGGRRTGKFSGDTDGSKKKDLKKKSRKGSKRYAVESSDSFISSSESDVEFVNHSADPVFVPSDAPRRSTRKRTNISYHEDDNDDDFHVATKKSQESKMSSAEAGPCKQKDRPVTGESVPNTENARPTNAECSWKQNNETGSTILGESSEEKISDHDEESDSYECPDPEFSDFDKARDENCFAVNQFWACYGGKDGMPRFYAKVKEVSVSPFELSFAWLESDPTNENHGKLIDNLFPVGCGWFKLGKTERNSRRLMFSHQVHFVRGKKRGSLLLRPRQSEIWALFKESDVNSSSNHEYGYEIVEVLSDFTEDSGIRVCYLNKVVGFVSLFQSSRHNEADSFLISPTELYRFSHGIPFFKMTGSEREGVPVGSFELDPASLPTHLVMKS